MAKYILVYNVDKAQDWSRLPEPEKKQVIEDWNAWVASMGSNHGRGGAFKFSGKSVRNSGVTDANNLLTGFAEFEAENMEAAVEAAQGAPLVQKNTGSIEVYELLTF
jgi:hypothetical protein